MSAFWWIGRDQNFLTGIAADADGTQKPPT